MAEDKEVHPRGHAGQADSEPSTASRARNKTVMLSPEMTGQVRAILNDPAPGTPQQSGKAEDYLPPLVDWGTGAKPQGGADEGFLRPKGAPDGFSTMDSIAESNAPKFDPLTSVAPSVTFGGMGRDAGRSEPQSAPEPRGSSSLFGSDSGLLFGNPASGAPTAFQVQTSQAQSFTSPPTSSFAMPQQQSFAVPQMSQPAPQRPPVVAPQVPQAAPLAQQPIPQPAPQRAVPQPPAPAVGPKNWHTVVSNGNSEAGKLVGLFVSYDRLEGGEIFEIRSGRFLITSRPTDNGDYLLVNDESISALHAIVRATKDGALQVLDQLSEYGTGVTKAGAEEEEEVSGSLAAVQHGDIVRFGKRTFTVVSIPQQGKQK